MKNFLKLAIFLLITLTGAQTASAQMKLKPNYKCQIIPGDRNGAFRDDLASKCKYKTLKSLAFHWKGVGAAKLDFDSMRQMSAKEFEVPGYWLKRISKLDVSDLTSDFDLEWFLKSASSADQGYVLEAAPRGENTLDLVFVADTGHQFSITAPKGLPLHEPYGFWFTE